MLEKEQAKVKSLEDIIGDETQGLQKNLADLTAQVNIALLIIVRIKKQNQQLDGKT